jgi:hypothetical protein
MAKLIFKMRDVPDDEAEEVRSLLEENQIEYFETSAGNWGVSMPALWLKDEAQFSRARELIDEYQSQRSERIKQEYSESLESGEAKSMWNSFSENPVRFAAYLALISAVLFISLEFFLSF